MQASRSMATQQAKKTIWERLPFPIGQRPWWIDGTRRVPDFYEESPQVWRNAVTREFDRHKFDRQVFYVAASGFLSDSYALFATNVILPSLAYIYWPDITDGNPELKINCATLAGSAVGQLLFGWLADKLGRRKLYGLELVIVIFGTLGMAQASTGIYNNMNILSWIIFYRFILGVGIGAEYPLSAVISGEFASKNSRAKMMAAVFLMQPLGQILAAAVGWGVLTSLVRSRGLDTLPAHGADLSEEQKRAILSTIDTIWRCVIGVGSFPALAAILYRFSIPESPRYTMDVDRDAKRAYFDYRRHTNKRDNEETVRNVRAGIPPDDATTTQYDTSRRATGLTGRTNADHTNQHAHVDGIAYASRNTVADATRSRHGYTTRSTAENEAHQLTVRGHFITEGNWRYLFATAFCWFLLDFAFYGLGINNPRQLAAIWATSLPVPEVNATAQTWPSTQLIGLPYVVFSNATVSDWQNPFDPGTNIYWELFDSAKEYILTISCGSLAGSFVLIWIIDYVPRKACLVLSFLILSLFFAIMGSFFAVVEFQPAHWATVVFYALCQFFFNLGPNTLTFIISAEIFPTKFRCTCHGISAAMGKVGAICVQVLLGRSVFSTDPGYLGLVLGIFSIPMALGALLAWVWIPKLQTNPDPGAMPRPLVWPRLPNKSLEDLARGWMVAVREENKGGEGQKLGFARKIQELQDLWYRMRHRGFPIESENEDGTELQPQNTATPGMTKLTPITSSAFMTNRTRTITSSPRALTNGSHHPTDGR